MASKTKAALEATSLVIELVLKFSILCIVVFAIATPGNFADHIRKALDSAGLELQEISLFGFKFSVPDSNVASAKAFLERTSAELDELNSEIQQLRDLVICKETGDCSDQQEDEIARVSADPDAQMPEATTVIAFAAAINKLEQLPGSQASTAGPEPALGLPDPGILPWVVVVGADRTLASAQNELSRLSDGGYNSGIVKRGNFFRTIAFFPNQGTATLNKSEIGLLMGRRVFVLEMSGWCPDPVSGQEFDMCAKAE